MPDNAFLIRADELHFGISQCGPISAEHRDEETERAFTVVFPLRGVFSVDTGAARISGTPAKILLFSRGQNHEVHHPFGGHDVSAFISMSSSIIESFLDDSGWFVIPSAPTRPEIDYAIRSLVGRGRRGQVEPLEVEEFAIAALGAVTGVCVGKHSRAQRDLVSDVEELLSIGFRDDLCLSTIARQVGASPHHLSRVFKQVTGENMSRRRMRLRLNHALEQVLGGADDLSRVAVEAGFYDHSHLSNSFRAHFGVTPSSARSTIDRRT
jgi:AraC-like DNA-binding protein